MARPQESPETGRKARQVDQLHHDDHLRHAVVVARHDADPTLRLRVQAIPVRRRQFRADAPGLRLRVA